MSSQSRLRAERSEATQQQRAERSEATQQQRAERSEATQQRGVLTRGHVVIDVAACKGCELCIDACPPRVLEMTTHAVNATGYRYPVLLPGCTGCKACSQICPDFVFQVYKLEAPLTVSLDDEGSNA